MYKLRRRFLKAVSKLGLLSVANLDVFVSEIVKYEPFHLEGRMPPVLGSVSSMKLDFVIFGEK